MSWHYLQELVAESSEVNSSGGGPSAPWKKSRTAEKCSSDVNATVCYPCSRSGTTSGPSTADPGVGSWISFLRASRVNRSVSPASSGERTTSATCGQTPSVAFAKWSRDSHCWKTYPDLFPVDISDGSSGIWPKAGTARNGAAYLRGRLEHISEEKDYGSLPRVPRPVACDWKGSGRIRHERFQKMNLRDWWNENYRFVYPPASVGEYLMGFPTGWTGLEPLGTLKYRRWCEKHGVV